MGLDASDAMITNLALATHPGLNISRHFRMDLPPVANNGSTIYNHKSPFHALLPPD